MLKKIIGSLCLFSLIAFVQAEENSNAFNKYMSPEGGVNPMSGTVALEKNIASISSGQINANFSLKYSGNVFREAKKTNDRATNSLVGLGWSFGRSQIICDCKENSFLGDDLYYLVTADGSKYQIFEEKAWRKRFDKDYDANASEKWWIEGNPFWNVERIVGSTILLGEGHHVWTYVKGWKITDAAGVVHTYGDVDEKNSLIGPTSPAKSTEYDLIWLTDEKHENDAFGIMEETYGGSPSYYPIAWNLSEEKALDGSKLVYTYEQVLERLTGFFKKNKNEYYMDESKKNKIFWNSNIGYTKETYLKSVVASNEAEIDFFYEKKGQNQFKNEFIDAKGVFEDVDDPGSDMFKEKIQRKFLSSIVTYGAGHSLLGKINFCYKTLNEGTDSVKRLLSAIRFENNHGKEVDYEEYSYFDDDRKMMASKDEIYDYPLGALYEVRGKNCGVVRYSYMKESLGYPHYEELSLDTAFGIGSLENGTSYLVGKLDDKIKIFVRTLGKWEETSISGDLDYTPDRVDFGDAGWFLAVKKDSKASVLQWDGKEWCISVKKSYGKTNLNTPNFKDYKFQDVVAGPDYALVYTIDDEQWDFIGDEFLKVEVFWSKWNGVEKNYDEVFRDVADNNGQGYKVVALKNFILLQYQTEWCKGNCTGYRVLAFRDGEFVKVKINGDNVVDGRDTQNQTYLKGSWLIEAGEADYWYDNSRVQINGWNGNEWIRQLTYDFKNSDPMDVRAIGSDYFVVRYNDSRHLRIFSFDGEKWDGSALHEKYFNYSLSNAYKWDGVGTEDFFVTTRSYRKKWNDVKKNNKVKLYYNKNGNGWLSTDYGRLDGYESKEKSLAVGTDWFIENKASKTVWIWDGNAWKTEDLNKSLKNYSKIYSLGGDVLAASTSGKTKLFYKIENSFINPFGAFMISEKKILEPVADRIVTYKYTFLSEKNNTYASAFDEKTNTPLMTVMKIEIPNKKGTIERRLCDVKENDEKIAVGLVCSEIQRDQKGATKISQTKTNYERVRKDWPNPIFFDRVKSTISVARGLKNVVQNTYSDQNGMLTDVQKRIGNRQIEEKYLYVTDLESVNSSASSFVSSFVNQNRWSALAGSYSCIPNCKSGRIVSANANGFTDANEIKGYFDDDVTKENFDADVTTENLDGDELKEKLYVATSSWKLSPKKNVNEVTLRNQILNIALNESVDEDWERQSYNSRYSKKNIVETLEGPRNVKMSSFYENKVNGRLLGVAANCGIDEGLMLSGESCEVASWSGCESKSLDGYVVSALSNGATDYSSYGRFSKKVIKIAGTPLVGTIPSVKDVEYVFSAWIQYRPENGLLTLSVGNDVVASWEMHPISLPADSVGKWKRIEWTGNIKPGENLSLNAKNISTEVRLQDIRFLPKDAISKVNYWNDEWNNIQTTVDSKGIASFVDFDEQGRISKRYSELNDGTVFLSSMVEYEDGNCSAYPNGSDRLVALFLNGKAQQIPTDADHRQGTFVLDDPSVRVEFVPAVARDGVVYRFYKEGSNPGDWLSSSCGGLCYPSFYFTPDANSWILEIDVEPYDETRKYVFNIKKKQNDWVEYGSFIGFAKGDHPMYVNPYDLSNVVLKNNKGMIELAEFKGNEWSVNLALNERVAEFNTFKGNSGSYVSTITAEEIPSNYSYLNYPKVFKVASTGLEQKNISEKRVRADNIVLSEMSNSNLVMLYNADGRVGVIEKKNDESVYNDGSRLYSYEGIIYDEALYAMEWNPLKQDFEYLGSTPEFSYATSSVDNTKKQVSFFVGEPLSYKKGMVNDYPAEMSDMVVGPDGNLYVAYIGLSKFFTVCSENNEKKTNCETETPFVYVKRLYSPYEIKGVNESVWAGVSQIDAIPLYQGDILSWSENTYDAIDGVKKIKLDYDGNFLYLAVSYSLKESDEEKSTSMSRKSNLALTVFKGLIEHNKNIDGKNYTTYLKWTPLKDLSISYVNESSENQYRVAYLDDNDDFDFIVRNSKPYIMFRNADNNGGITVIKYENNKWVSVGNPSFAYPSKSIGSADFGVDYGGVPFVVFQTDNSILNVGRENKIVGMRYIENNALDLTLSSFETNNAEFNNSCDFRSYILSYSANLNENPTFTFKAIPRRPEHVRKIQLFSNDNFLMSISDFSKDVTIPLTNGLNNLEVRVVGYDGRTLSYTFDLYRYYAEIPNMLFAGLSARTSISYVTESQNSGLPEELVVDLNPITIENGKYVSQDIHIPPGWELTLNIDGDVKVFSKSTNVLIPVDKHPLTVGFLSNTKTGATIPVTITNTNWYDDPKTVPWYNNPEENSSASESQGSSSSSAVNHEMSENVPFEVRNVSTATIFATTDVFLADNVYVKGDILAGKSLSVGVTASTKNNVYSGGSVILRNRADVENVYYVSNFDVQDGAKFASVTKTSGINIPLLPTYSFDVGKERVTVENGKALTLTNGSYGDFVAQTGSTVYFGAGDYYFNSFYTDSDVKLIFTPQSRVWVKGSLRIGNGCKVVHAGKVGDLFMYVDGNVTVETNVEFHAVLLAPNAKISFSTGLVIHGFIYGSAFSIQPNSIIE